MYSCFLQDFHSWRLVELCQIPFLYLSKMVMWYVFDVISMVYHIYWLVYVESIFKDKAFMVIIYESCMFLNSFCILLETFACMLVREISL